MLAGKGRLGAVFGNSLVLLLCVGAIAVGVRCYRLGRTEITVDEAFSWRLTQYHAGELIRHTAMDVHPPLYYLALKAWQHLSGDSPQSLRGFSVLCGVLSILMLYLLCLEAGKGESWCSVNRRTVVHGGALFSAFLMAIHLSQVTASRTARMYSLGILLAGLTSWLLLRALHAKEKKELWWSAYGLGVTAFCYTHYYAFFTVAAQGVFVLGDVLARARSTSFRETFPSILGFTFAGTVWVLLYSPWLPVLRQEVDDVRRMYGLGPLTVAEAEEMISNWVTGMEYKGRLAASLWFVPLAVVALWRIVMCGDRAATFFFIQAAVPWVLSMGLSVWSGRSIVVERYLAFAHVSLLGLWGVTWSHMRSPPLRALVACWLGIPCIYGLGTVLERIPPEVPAITNAAVVLKRHYLPGDVVLVTGAPAVNKLRYHATQVGLEALSVRCVHNPLWHKGHTTHVAGLQGADFLLPDEQVNLAIMTRRIWHGSEGKVVWQTPPKEMETILEETLDGGGGTEYSLVLYAKTERGK